MPNHSGRLTAACIASAFAGGALCTLALHFSLEARAEDPSTKVLKAERFEIVDKDDKVIGYLGKGQADSEFGLHFGKEGDHSSVLLTTTCLTLGKEPDGRALLGQIPDAKKNPKFGIAIENSGEKPWRQP